jgi:hypothetical protein
MTINQAKTKEGDESFLGLRPYLLGFVVLVAAALIIIPLLPALLSNFLYSFSGHAPKIYWYLSRSAGFVALTVLWAAMALGLSITNKMARLWPGAPTAFAIHEYVSLLGLAFVVYHGLVLIGDHFVDFSLPRLAAPFSIGWKTGDQVIGFSLPQLADPFSEESKPFWIGLGQVGFYVWVIAALSFYVRRWIGQKTWRLIHYANFATYIMGWLHGTFTGTDSGSTWVRWYYWISGGSLMILLAYRIYDSALKKNFSIARFIGQRALSISHVFSATKNRLILPKEKEKNLPEALLREQAASLTASTDKTVMPAITISTSPQAVNDNPPQVSQEEKTRPRTSEIPAADEPSQPTTDSPSVAPETKTTSPFIEKYEIGSGKDKINVRIFKEPTTENSVQKLQTDDAKPKQVGTEALALRLKRDFTATPTRPRPLTPFGRSKRTMVLEE